MFDQQRIRALLDSLAEVTADELEGQDIDFKRWPESKTDAVAQVVAMAVCMANGGGGTVVFGVADRVVGRADAIPGVPFDIDMNRLKKAVYDSTDPKITPEFEDIPVPEGTGRLLAMHIHPGIPPYTDTRGQATIRIGKDCQPLTGTLRRRIAEDSGENDFTATCVPGEPATHLSAVAMERLRQLARMEQAPNDLTGLADDGLLSALHLIRDGRLTVAGLLLAGREESLREHIPGAGWTWLRMRSETEYENREDGITAIPLAVTRLEELLRPYNPLATLKQGFFHFEYRRWPEDALREALMNAFCHRDYRRAGSVVMRLETDGLSVESLGGFVSGIRPDNILRHPPATRNPALVSALLTLRLINRANLGIKRMYEAMLVEGKPPPSVIDVGDAVRVLFPGGDLSPAFRLFAAEEDKQGHSLGLDVLLTLNHLRHHAEADTATLARLCQRDEASLRNSLAEMEQRHYIERGGQTRGTYWTLHPGLRRRLEEGTMGDEARRRIDWDAAKTRILSIARERLRRGDQGLTNAEVRGITHYDRYQGLRLLNELEKEGVITKEGDRRATRWVARIDGPHDEPS